MAEEVGKASVIEKFDGTDFAYWRMQIEDYLYGRQLHLSLLGTKPETMKVEECFLEPCLVYLSTKTWLLPMLSSSTKTSLDTQNGYGKFLGYQPLKDIKMER